jgi:MFS family permease
LGLYAVSGPFRKLWAGQAISQLGSGITAYALPLAAVLLLGASPIQMGMLSGVSAAAVLGFSLFAGAWADRLRRRPILIAADLGRGLVLATIPLAAVLHRLTMGHLYFVAAATAILTVLFDVSYHAYLPTLVGRDELVERNSNLALTESIAEIAGPGLAGVLVQLITAPMAILFDAVSFFCSAVSLWLIRAPEPRPAPTSDRHLGREISEGLRAVWHDPILRALARRKATASFFLGFFTSLYVLFAIRELHLSAALMGAIIAVGGASNLLGSLGAKRLTSALGFGRTLIAAALLTGIASLLPPLAHGSVAACAAILIVAQSCDAGWSVYQINETSLRQAVTPNELLGRVNAAMHLLFRGVLPMGAMTAGVMAEAMGVRGTMGVGAVGLLVSTLWLVFSPVLQLGELPRGPQKVPT